MSYDECGMVRNPKWLNSANGGKEFYCTEKTEETRKKMKGNKNGKGNSNKPKSEDHRRKIGESRRGILKSDEQNRNNLKQ